MKKWLYIACITFLGLLGASENRLMHKPFEEMNDKERVLYDILQTEEILFSEFNLDAIEEHDGQCDNRFEQAYQFYRDLRVKEGYNRSWYNNHIKQAAAYLYKLLFIASKKTKEAFEPFSGEFAALLIGIDYENTSLRLQNCIHDIEHIRDQLLLPQMGIKKQDIIFMSDHEKGENYPTRDHILRQFDRFAHRLNEAGQGYFHYSGHGTFLKDDSGDELDGRDEALCPVDCERNGMIRDDLLFSRFIRKLGSPVKLIITTDCCHSGTILDLPYRYNKDGSYQLQGRHSKEDLARLADVVMISGCRDDQTSADGGFMQASKGSGAMTAAYLETLKAHQFNLTYRQLINTMHRLLRKHGYLQKPVLSTTHPVSLDDPFMTSRVALRAQ